MTDRQRRDEQLRRSLTVMKLSKLVPPGAIVSRLTGTDRDSVVRELVDALIRSGAADASLRDELINRVLERERRGSTGFGKGIAVPHVKHKSVKGLAAAVGLSATGIDFSSLDKQPVFSVFLLLSPEDRPEEHLQAMELIFKNLSKETFRRFLRQAVSPEEVRNLLEEADGQHAAG
ncbi:MAG TPA: PTS sugar transporter subunit IIA [Phycisphaerales bacterium]|nr:PTS sugar transporter subunit IIA [Phycisphaerales bacterium]HPO94070.1 PTS sugar transporter subunit IIA [Phycisphaerales bacterium]